MRRALLVVGLCGGLQGLHGVAFADLAAATAPATGPATAPATAKTSSAAVAASASREITTLPRRGGFRVLLEGHDEGGCSQSSYESTANVELKLTLADQHATLVASGINRFASWSNEAGPPPEPSRNSAQIAATWHGDVVRDDTGLTVKLALPTGHAGLRCEISVITPTDGRGTRALVCKPASLPDSLPLPLPNALVRWSQMPFGAGPGWLVRSDTIAGTVLGAAGDRISAAP